jgi:hypothetical protein
VKDIHTLCFKMSYRYFIAGYSNVLKSVSM